MVVLLTILHVVFCLFLILVILLQTGKGAGMGVAFGGASQTVFGPRGAGSFIGKTTAVVAILFMVTSLLLAFLSSSRSTGIAEKADALAEKRSGEVEEVDLNEAATEPALPPDGESKEPEPALAADGGAAAGGDAGVATDGGAAGTPGAAVAEPPDAEEDGAKPSEEADGEPEADAPPADESGDESP